jgi:hypothetical protein
MLDDALDYVELLRERPVWQPIPGEVRERFREPLPRTPTDLAEVHVRFLKDILPYATGNPHPRFMDGSTVAERRLESWLRWLLSLATALEAYSSITDTPHE